MPHSDVSKPYTPTERQNTKLILAAIKKYIEESFRDPYASDIIGEMYKINPEMDKIRAGHIFDGLKEKLISDGVIAELPATTGSGVPIKKYHILKSERLWQ